jgi:hypothetical protein
MIPSESEGGPAAFRIRGRSYCLQDQREVLLSSGSEGGPAVFRIRVKDILSEVYVRKYEPIVKEPDLQYLKFILFWNNSLRVLDGLSIIRSLRLLIQHQVLVIQVSMPACWQTATEPVWYDAVFAVLDSL